MALSTGNPVTTPLVDDTASAALASMASLMENAGMALDGEQLRQLAAYRDLLYSVNQSTNLTAIRDLPGIERRLILESLRLVAPLRSLPDTTSRRTLLDVGTGAGLPGLVLAIACPEFSVFLLDATSKKVAFLDRVVQELGLGNVTTIHARAEEIGQQPRYRQAFDVVSARAVATLPALLELGLPLLRPNGRLLLPKGVAIDEELAAGHRAAAILGGDIVTSAPLPDVGSTIDTRLVIVHKIARTPVQYPRRPGIPSKSPLGLEPGPGAVHHGSNTS